VDPQAADVVFRSGVDLTVLPLDVTHRALILEEHLERFRALGTPVGTAVAGLLDFYERYDIEKYGSEGGPLHDPCVIAYLLKPELFSGRFCNVAVETVSELTMGMTVVDWWGETDREPNATWIREIDAPGFFDLLVDRLARL
jgi:purine nucleosidase